ncbi:M50 family metallopeptidase [Kineococcus terrestris]|uniref:M50 family metallopeptidase n=1 Tax=Kineococcus terrestris TaxID=2044856 RepID=UPI0034DB4226
MSGAPLVVVGVLVAALGVAVSIALHEVGHLVPAKRFGVKVTQYMVGFGPTLFSRRRGETEYGVKAIPLGGYIRMIGMFPPAPGADPHRLRASSTGRWALMAEEARRASFVEIGPGEERRTFYRLPVWKRIVVMAGGPLMNLLLALVLTALALSAIGTPQTTTRVAAVSQCLQTVTDASGECAADDPLAPGAAAGVLPGDEVVEFDGVAVTSWAQLSGLIQVGAGREVPLVVERDGQRVPLRVTPVLTSRAAPGGGTEQVGMLGITSQLAVARLPVAEVPGLVADQVEAVAGIVVRLPQRLYDVAQAAFGSAERDPDGPIGVVGVGRIAGELNALPAVIPGDELAERTSRLLTLLAGLNVALFVFNLVPLLPFDGGHIAGALWEALKRGVARLRRKPDPGPVDVAKAMPVAYAVSVLLIGMSALLLYADVVRPVQIG